MNSSDRQLISAFKIIGEMCERIHLAKSIKDQADLVYTKALETKQLKGKNSEAVAAACLYIACRKEGVPRTFKEICAVSRVGKKEIGRCYKLIIRALETNLELITSADYMSRFCGNLNLPTYIQTAATHIARKAADDQLVAGRSPISIAAAAIYMASQASDDKRGAKEIGDVAGVAEVTIRQSYKLMYPKALDLFPADYRYYNRIPDLPSS